MINRVGGQCQVMRSRFLVNRFGSLPTLHLLCFHPLVGSGEKCYDLVNRSNSLPTLHLL
ncbi:MAG: hypothetical protein F6K55_14510 [Moorea sp. SIO4A3]|nr:hypothetical protein [Moorena sp. SIO4A3]